MTTLTDRCDEAMARAAEPALWRDIDNLLAANPTEYVSTVIGTIRDGSIIRSRAARLALLSELDAAGWQVVPKVADTDMLQDGRQAYKTASVSTISGMTIEAQILSECRREAVCYAAMLSAAPHPFQEDKS